MHTLISLLVSLLVTPAIPAQNEQPRTQASDLCHVYVLDVQQTERLTEEFLSLPNPTEAQALALKKKYPDAERILGEFEANVGEEVLTTRSYNLAGTRQYVTASVYYTDEMMRSTGYSDSMNVAIVVSPQRHENAMVADNNSTGQVSYNDRTDKVQIKTRLRIGGRLKLVGLECQVRARTLQPVNR